MNTDNTARERKPRGHASSPVIGNNGMLTEPGDNAKYLMFDLSVARLPSIDIRDNDQLMARIDLYFDMCVQADLKPAVSGLAMALGIDRRRLWEIANNNDKAIDVGVSSADSIKKAYQQLNTLWEHYMLNGKINPMAGVFLGVNNHGYFDVKQINITPTTDNPLQHRDIADAHQYIKQLGDGLPDD